MWESKLEKKNWVFSQLASKIYKGEKNNILTTTKKLTVSYQEQIK